jgi:hypothetical protein
MYLQLPSDFPTCTCLLLCEVQSFIPPQVDIKYLLWPWYRLLQHFPLLSSGAATDWRGLLLASLARAQGSLPKLHSATQREYAMDRLDSK